jgi:hypothetical protein
MFRLSCEEDHFLEGLSRCSAWISADQSVMRVKGTEFYK